MTKYHLSILAAEDLASIAEYTIEQFGIQQARSHRDGFESCFQSLVENPDLGRSAEMFAANLKRFEFRSHVIFYRKDVNGLFIVRVLHQRMDLSRHL